MKNFTFLIIFLLISSNSMAGFEPITVVRPSEITSDTEVMLGYDPFQYPCLRPLPNFLGQTHLLEMDENNNINFYVTAWGTDPCLNLNLENPLYEFFNLGTFPEGTYHIQFIWVGTSTPLPVPSGGGFELIGEVITFEVFASIAPIPTVIPIFSIYSLIFLCALLIIFSLFHLRRKQKYLTSIVLVLSIFTTSINAKTFHITLSKSNDSPSSEEVVNQAATSPSPPVWLLSSFNESSPSSVDYLVKKRATGNLLNLLTQHQYITLMDFTIFLKPRFRSIKQSVAKLAMLPV